MNDTPDNTIDCWIYRSSKKDEMYLYLAREDDFDDIPKPLMQGFGTPQKIMELTLSPERPLAREDVAKVMDNLRQQGFHLQMPPKLTPDMYYGEDL